MDLLDDPMPGSGPGQNAPEFTVSEISGAVKRAIEGEFGHVRVRGEVGRVVLARTGHLYFDLKDDRNVLAAVSWKGQVARLSTRPEEGMEVIVTGRLTTFGPQSKYQINVEDVTVAGAGALMAMLEKRKTQLAAEGLFAAERKRPLPYLPEVIGVVTSPSGAVIRDILHRLRDRFPRRVLIWPVAVQGAACAPEVAAAIAGFNRLAPGGAIPRPDLIIVARGGGSIEDLWGFNEEIVARAAAASDIPLISAVGHETDTTLIDFAADQRAPTPTAAAEMAVPVRRDLIAWTAEQGGRLEGALTKALGQRRQRLSDLSRLLPRPETLLDTPRQRLDRASEKLPRALVSLTQAGHLRLTRATGGLKPATLTSRLAGLTDRLKLRSEALAVALARPAAEKRRAFDRTAARLDPARLARLHARASRDFDALAARFATAAQTRTRALRRHLDALERTRQSLGYHETLKRGFAVVRGDGALVTTRTAAAAAQRLEIEFADGRLELGEPAPARPKPKAKPDQGPDQGSLF